MIGEIRKYGRFAFNLYHFLKHPLSPDEIRSRMENTDVDREAMFLHILKRTVYENSGSPYLDLLEMAGCEYGDIEKLALSDGLEAALMKLASEGVYLSIEEFKGKKPVERSGRTFNFGERAFDNPHLASNLVTTSSGSRSAGTRTIYDFEHIENTITLTNVHRMLMAGIDEYPIGFWMPVMPSGGPMLVLAYAKAGKAPVKWFSPLNKEGFKPLFRDRLGTAFLIEVARLAGTGMSRVEYVAYDDAGRITDWLYEQIRRFGSASLYSYPSGVIRVCQAAREKNIDLTGANFFCGGEPLTEAKKKQITDAGARVFSNYGFIETGSVGICCLNPETAGEVHFIKNYLGFIQVPREVPHAGLSVDAFKFTTLLPTAPKILINVESGDYGRVFSRDCGCPYEKIGFALHISDIRGFDKLTGEGMTFVGTDMLRVIESVLPARFGGSASDYQMVEEEDEKGRTRLNLIVHPRLGDLDEAGIRKTVLDELSKGPSYQKMMAHIWSEADTLKVTRSKPLSGATGKLMPLHIRRQRSNGRSPDSP